MRRLRVIALCCALAAGTAALAQESGGPLDFENALGNVDDATCLAAPAPITFGAVTFNQSLGDPVWNCGMDTGTNPFTSDYFGFWTYGEGGTMTFATPISSVSFKAGANNSLDNVFDAYANGVMLQTFTTNRFTATSVTLTFNSPVTQVLIKGNVQLSSSTLLWIDDLSYVESNTSPGSDVEVVPETTLPDGSTTTISLTFDTVESSGETRVTTSSAGAPPPSGFKLTNPPVYYEISTSATFTGSVRVCLSWTEGQIANESQVKMFHFEGNQWVDITDPTSRDRMNNTVCGTTSSLSPFALMEVKHPFTGFFQPVDNLPTVNAVKAGAGVPVKFSLGGSPELNIFASGYPKAQLMQCETGEPIAAIEETVSAGSSSLSYDAASGTYTYVWKTEKAWANSCRELQLKLNDGEVYTARFTLRK